MNSREEIFNTMSRTGGVAIACGIVTVVTGVASGVLMIVCGARLLLRRRKINL